jgi:heat shock protein HslJ
MRLMLIGTAALLLGACAHHAQPGEAPGWMETPTADVAQLESGATWRRVDDLDANPHAGTITFEDARASGSTGCNRWFAAVTRDGETLRFGDAGVTRMACAEPAMAAEERFLAMLQVTRGARMDGEGLVLTDHAGREVGRFVRER